MSSKKYILIVSLFLILNSQFVYSKNIPINFKNTDIKSIIRLASKILNKNIIFYEQLQGHVTFYSKKSFTKKEFLVFVKDILKNKGYQLIEERNYYKIVKKDDAMIRMVKVKHLHINNVEKLLHTMISKNELKISSMKNKNFIILRGKKDILDKFETLIHSLDKEPYQVFVKARIIEVNNASIDEVGIKYGIKGAHYSNGNLLTFASNLNSMNNQATLPLKGFNLAIPNVNSILALGASISLLSQNRALNIISEPSILCLNNQESSIYVGETKSIKTGSTTTDGGTVNNTYVRENIGLILKVKPRISSKNKVLLNIHTVLENASLTKTTNDQPDTFKKEINTVSLVQNGQSIILGGLIENKSEKGKNDVPFISSIPLLGNLFKHNDKVVLKKNLVVIITPYVVSNSNDITFLREQLVKLTELENKYLQDKLNYLNKKEEKITKNNNYYEDFQHKYFN